MNDPRAPHRGDRLIALALALATFAALALTERDVGFPRDEGTYFSAGASYAAWYKDLWSEWKQGRFAAPFSDDAIARRFEPNHEHPALMKTLYGLSHALFTERLGLVRDAAGYRLPAFLFSGILSALLFLMTSRLVSRWGGVFAVAAFWLAPRHFFHGHLACFDMPIAAAWLGVVYCYWRSRSNPRWAIVTGIAFGLALAIKHNAWILPGVLALHWALSTAWREQGLRRSLMPFVWMALLGPALFFLHWPWLWHHPIDRIGFYVAFHTEHINYPWEYFGRLLVEAPFPAFYAFGLTAVTFPLATLALATTGSLAEIGRFAAWAIRPLRRWVSPIDSDSLLVLGNAFASLAVFSLPSTPIFGGMKHWLPSMIFLCVLAARALQRIVQPLRRAWAMPAAAALVLLPSAWGLARNHPYGTSDYNELAGGTPGAATLGMHRQYWSQNVTGVLPWLNAHAPRNARVYFHEVTWDAIAAYKKNGMLRKDLRIAGDIEGSDLAVYQYMPEFRDIEFEIWNRYGTRKPVHGLYLDETPQIVVYARPDTQLVDIESTGDRQPADKAAHN